MRKFYVVFAFVLLCACFSACAVNSADNITIPDLGPISSSGVPNATNTSTLSNAASASGAPISSDAPIVSGAPAVSHSPSVTPRVAPGNQVSLSGSITPTLTQNGQISLSPSVTPKLSQSSQPSASPTNKLTYAQAWEQNRAAITYEIDVIDEQIGLILAVTGSEAGGKLTLRVKLDEAHASWRDWSGEDKLSVVTAFAEAIQVIVPDYIANIGNDLVVVFTGTNDTTIASPVNGTYALAS